MDGSAELMHDSAVRVPTPAPHVDRILTGHEERPHVACWRPGGTSDWLLLYTLAGGARISTAGEDVIVGPSDTVVYRPGTPQDFGTEGAPSPWRLVWAHFDPLPHWLELLRWPELAPGILHLRMSEPSLRSRVETLLLEANRLFGSGLPRADRLAQHALEGALLWLDLQNPAQRSLDPRVLAAIDLLATNAHTRLSIDELARAVHLSPSRFAHLFRQETGLPPGRFAERQRIERAKQLLELTALPVAAVAAETGFRSQFYFASRFRKLTGTSPTGFRAQTQSQPTPPGRQPPR
jgi:AraC family transcriptional regulator, arabinose operon regulatory protein